MDLILLPLLQQNQVVLEGLAHIPYQSGVPLAAVTTWGDLTLNQRNPLPPTGTYSIYNTPAMPKSVSAADWRLESILAEYWERNSKYKSITYNIMPMLWKTVTVFFT